MKQYKVYGELHYRTKDQCNLSETVDFEVITDGHPDTYEDVEELIIDNVEYVGEWDIPVMQLDGEFGDFEVEWFVVEEFKKELV
jgi:hypothetical protein